MSGIQVVQNWMRGIVWRGCFGDGYREVGRLVVRTSLVQKAFSSLAQSICDRGPTSLHLSPLRVVGAPRLSTAMLSHWLHSRVGFECSCDYGPQRGQRVFCS